MIDLTYENQGTNTFLVCKLDPQDVIDTMSMGMISNNKILGVMTFSYSRNDSERFFKYNISSKINLKQYFSGQVKKRSLLTVFSSIASSILNSEEYMVEVNKFMIDAEYIYVNVTTAEASLICLPIVKEEETTLDMCKFFKDIVYDIQFDQTENCDYVAKIISFLNSNTNFSLIDFKNILDSVKSEVVTQSQIASSVQIEKKPVAATPKVPKAGPRPTQIPKEPTPPIQKEVKPKKERKCLFGWGKKKKKVTPIQPQVIQTKYAVPGVKVDIAVAMEEIPKIPQIKKTATAPVVQLDLKQNFGETTVLGVSTAGETTVLSVSDLKKTNIPFMIRIKSGEKINIDKPVFRIGKEKSYVDYFIADNTAVSRSHADIITKDDEYFLLDNNSTNHTYIDNVMVQSNVETKIAHGSKMKFANEEFEFKLF